MIKNLLMILIFTFTSLLLVASPAALASSNGKVFGVCNNGEINNTSGGSVQNSSVCQNQNTTSNPVVDLINTAANVAAAVGGIIAVIMVIVSGLTYVGSAGNPEAAASARKHIMYALIGVVVIVLAWAITKFIVDVIL